MQSNIASQEFAKAFLKETTDAIESINLESIAAAASLLHRAALDGRHIFFLGNGGSHSIATHMAADLGKGTKIPGSNASIKYRTLSLDNAAWVSAQANDGAAYFLESKLPGIYEHGYDGVFVGQLENLMETGDVVFAISSSGNSRNIINALLYARERGAQTVAMVGFDGGEAAKIADLALLVETDSGKYGVVEAVHGVIHHYLYEFLRNLALNG